MQEEEVARLREGLQEGEAEVKRARRREEEQEMKISQSREQIEVLQREKRRLEGEVELMMKTMEEAANIDVDMGPESLSSFEEQPNGILTPNRHSVSRANIYRQSINHEMESLRETNKECRLTIERLRIEIARKDEWADTLSQHVKIKNGELRRLKNEFLKLKAKYEDRVMNLETKLLRFLEHRVQTEERSRQMNSTCQKYKSTSKTEFHFSPKWQETLGSKTSRLPLREEQGWSAKQNYQLDLDMNIYNTVKDKHGQLEQSPKNIELSKSNEYNFFRVSPSKEKSGVKRLRGGGSISDFVLEEKEQFYID
jgi:chromosome segregation ATPase